MGNEYFIFTDDGKKFCKRTEDENGNVIVETPNGRMSLMKLQLQALNPAEAYKNRGKRKKVHI